MRCITIRRTVDGFSWRWATVLALLVWAPVAMAVDSEPDAVLAVGTASGNAGDEISLPVTLIANGTQASAINLELQYDPQQLLYKSVTTGPAASSVDKYADGYQDEVGIVHIIIYGMNTNSMGNGVIAEVVFEVVSGGTGMYVTASDAAVATVDTVLAANRLVYYASAQVTASQGQSDGVLVQWAAVPGATAYQLYRSEANDPQNAEAITDWLAAPGTSYHDTSAAAATVSGSGCAGANGSTEPTYYYWVRARNEAQQEGTLNAVAGAGYRGAAKSLAGVGDVIVVLSLLTGLAAAGRRRTG
jgi:hypothetical protein